MAATPAKLPARIIMRHARQRLSQEVTISLAHAEVWLAVGGELVGLIKNHQVIWLDGRLLQPREHALPGKRVNTANKEVTLQSSNGVVSPGFTTCHHAKRQAEKRAHLSLPVADQPCWGTNEHPVEQAPRQHLPNREPGHDRLASSRIVGEEEAQAGLLEHMLIDSDALMRQGIDE